MLQGLADLGYVDGRTVVIDNRFPNEDPELFKRTVSEPGVQITRRCVEESEAGARVLGLTLQHA